MRFNKNLVPLEGNKIVFAKDMAAMEKKAIDEGASGEAYMEAAAAGIYEVLHNVIEEDQALLLCLKGNNSGDAYRVGMHLLEAGKKVSAMQLAPLEDCSELCQKHAKSFKKMGGEIQMVQSSEDVVIPPGVFIVDGMLGTGFKGSVDGIVKDVIEKVNHTKNPVLAIDIPSGISGDSGLVPGQSALFADHTVYLGYIKWGHLFTDAYEHVGELHHVDFGMDEKYLDAIDPFGYLINFDVLKNNLPALPRRANKYSVGSLCILAGSKTMPGAALLASEAAYRMGAGLVRLFHPEGMESELSPGLREIIRTPITANLDPLFEEMKRSKCLLLGPGMGRTETVKQQVAQVCSKMTCPIVMDADALYYYCDPPQGSVLTPHRGEAIRLFNVDKNIDDAELIQVAQKFADEKKVVVVLKGAPSMILAPNKPKIVAAIGNPGMAKGGTGDVLAGMIASLIAQGKEPRAAAAIAVTVHSLAGNHAREKFSERSMIASDLINCIHDVFSDFELL